MKKQSTKLIALFLLTAGKKGNMLKTTKALIMASIALCAVSSQATLLAYEGFDTANNIGSDASAAGVTGSGFSAYEDTNYRMDLEAGLSYSDGSGNTLTATGRSAGMDVLVSGTQNLQLDLTSNIAGSGTIYYSFLTDITAATTWGVQIGLQDAFVGNGSAPTAALEAVFRSTSSNWGIYSDGNGIDSRTGPVVGTASYLVVSELNLGTGAMTTWLNPTDLENVSSGGALATLTGTATSFADMTGFIFSLGGEEAGTIDEIRIGTTIGDVTPIPEPATLGLMGVFGVAVLFIRRRLMI